MNRIEGYDEDFVDLLGIPANTGLVENALSRMTGSDFRMEKGGPDMLKVYCYNRCTTCKKALKWLKEHEIEYRLIDIKSDHPDEKTLRDYHEISGFPLKRFFNTSGIPYREMELSKKLPSMTEDEQFALLATDGMLVKRPLLVGDSFVLTGFKEAEWKEKLL